MCFRIEIKNSKNFLSQRNLKSIIMNIKLIGTLMSLLLN